MLSVCLFADKFSLTICLYRFRPPFRPVIRHDIEADILLDEAQALAKRSYIIFLCTILLRLSRFVSKAFAERNEC